MRLVVETIDPKAAKEMLLRSSDQPQRKIKPTLVAKLVHAMKAGQWQLTHQPIALDGAGVVIDGQHRLTAIIDSRTTQQVLVAYDADPATFHVIDTGVGRTVMDTLSIAGYTNVAVLGAVAKMLLTYDATVNTRNSWGQAARSFTSIDVVKVVESERGDRIMQAMSYGASVSSAIGRPGYKTILAAAFTILVESPAPVDLIAEYMARLHDGANLSSGSPMLALRRYLSADTGLNRTPGGAFRHQIGIAVVVKTFNAWLAGEARSVTVFKPGIEAMPSVEYTSPTPPAAPQADPPRTEGVLIKQR